VRGNGEMTGVRWQGDETAVRACMICMYMYHFERKEKEKTRYLSVILSITYTSSQFTSYILGS